MNPAVADAGSAPPPGLRGVIPPLCTPLTASGEVDSDSLDQLVEHVLSAGVDGVFVLGSTGEGTGLTDSQRRQVVAGTVARVAGRVPVLAGVLEPSTARVIAIGTQFRDLGADAIVATAPYYFLANERETDLHFRAVREQVGLPLVAYDIPVRVQAKVPLAVLVGLAHDGVLAAVKDSSGDEALMRALVDATSSLDDFTVLTGSEQRVEAHLAFGVQGNVPGLGNVDPSGFVRLYRAAARGDQATTRTEQASITRLTAMESVAEQPSSRSAIAAFKAALVLLGVIESATMTPPNVTLADHEVANVQAALGAAGLG